MVETATFGTEGRFGNNLFQFAAGKLLSKILNLNFHNPLDPKNYFNIFNNETATINNPIKYINDNEFKHIIKNSYDSNFLLQLKNSNIKTLFCAGYFQYSWALDMYCDEVRKFFILPDVQINNEDLAVHIRLGDFKFCHYNSGIIDYNWYLDILKNKQYKKLYIIVEAPTCKEEENYLKKFETFNPSFISNSPFEDFNFLRKFKKVIISNSTFSWWASFLGNAEEITLPENYNCFGVKMSGCHAHQEIISVRGRGERIPCKFIDIYDHQF